MKQVPKVSDRCRRDLRECSLPELIQRGINETLATVNEVRQDVEKTVSDKIVFGIVLIIGLQVSLLFELFIIPLNPVGGFWGIIISLVMLISALVGFTVFRAVYRRLTNGKY